jgi:hypothetical protein
VIVSRSQSNRNFLLVFSISFESTAYRSQIKCVSSFVNRGSLSMLAAGRHARPEVTSPVDGVAMVFY